MPISDLLYVFTWWIVLFITGLFFLPLAGRLFPRFLDRGYAFSKILGVIIVSYLVFIFGLFRILPFTPITIYILTIFSSVFIFLIFRKKLLNRFNKYTLILIILEEIIFAMCLLGWSYVRGFNPDIFGLEKYMDFGFVNSILRSTYFPPKDMWFPPHPINYYYFGHFLTAVLTKASGIPSFITYNLMIATLFALTFIECFSLGITIIAQSLHEVRKYAFRLIFGGLLIAGLVTLSGNLHVLYTFFKPYDVAKPVPMWNLEFSFNNPCYRKQSYEKNNHGKKEIIYCPEQEQKMPLSYPNTYWYPNATRFIYNTIHEFPIYSWVVADLHGHVADIPIVLLTIAVLFSILLHAFTQPENGKWIPSTKLRARVENGKLLIIGFLLAVMYMTNAWDGLTYSLLTGVLLLYLEWQRVTKNKHEYTENNPLLRMLPNNRTIEQLARYTTQSVAGGLSNFFKKHLFIDLITGIFVYLFIILSMFLIFSRPFSMNFDPSEIVGGIGVVGAPSFFLEKNVVDSSVNKYGYDRRGLLAKLFIPDHCRSIMTATDEKRVTTTYRSRKIGPFLFEPDHCLRSPWWQLLILYGFFYIFVFIFMLYTRNKNHIKSSDVFMKLLIAVSTFLIIIPEFFYMKDIYPDHYRANTMFKLVFQAFIMLSIVSGYTVLRTVSKQIFKSLPGKVKPLYIVFSLFTVLLLTVVFTYPYFAVQSYYNRLITYIGLDGNSYLKNRTRDDYEAIRWLNANLKSQPVILEAQGDSYTDYERISANTGLPTVLGWYVHEWLWRGQDAPGPRAEEVREIYESLNIDRTKNLLTKYKVSFVVIGLLETQKYPQLNDQKFNELGKKVFQSGNTKIYEIKSTD